jgi:DNA-binding response OmpR family regulator/tetratricopeptide (TPR) repeat protein
MKPSFGDRTIRARSEALVLVVAPEVDLREQLVDVLRSSEVGVLGARGSKDAMAILDRYPIEVAIIDAQLPEMSGFDLAKSVRRTHGDRIALIIITDVKWTQSQKAAAAQQMGLLDLLVKPVDPAAVAERVIEALDANSSSSARGAAGDTLVDDAATQQTPKPMDTIADEPLAVHDARRTIADDEDTAATVPVRSPNLAEDDLPDEPATIRAAPTTLDDDLPTEPYGDDDLATEPKGQDDPDTQRAEHRTLPRGQAPRPDRSSHAGSDATDVSPPPVDLLVDKATQSEKKAVERATRAAQAGPVEFRGNLTSTPFPRLLNRLYQRQDTGALFMLSGRIKKIIYFKEGHPCYIKSNRLSECLGKVLVRERMINEPQCRESLQRMKESHRQQGTVLIEMGVISPHDLVVGLELQLRTKLMDVFTWTRGEFLFKSEARVPSEVIRLDVSNATLIADGVRKTWGEKRLKGALRPYMERYIASNPDPELRFQELSLEPEEQALLDNIDGTRTLRELLASSPLPSRRAMGVAYVLLVTGVVQSQSKRHEQPMEREIAPPVAKPSTASEASVRERLAGQLLFWQKQNAFGVLGVSKGSTDAEVKQAYASLAREYHVDRFRHFSADTRRIAHECFSLVTQAHEQIAQLEQRKRYQHRITHELKVGTSAGSDALEAERYKKQASSLMERREWAEARQLLAKAVDLCQDAGDIRALLAWATYSSNTENASLVRKAIRELRRSIELDPKLYQAYLYLGRIYAGMGKTILAEKQFEKALQCNPDCGEALNELKIQKERRPPRRYRF